MTKSTVVASLSSPPAHARLCRALRRALKPGQTRLVMLESPTNPRMQICDISRLTELSHEVGRHILPGSHCCVQII